MEMFLISKALNTSGVVLVDDPTSHIVANNNGNTCRDFLLPQTFRKTLLVEK